MALYLASSLRIDCHLKFPIDNQHVVPLERSGYKMEVYHRLHLHTNPENLQRAPHTNLLVDSGVVFLCNKCIDDIWPIRNELKLIAHFTIDAGWEREALQS